MSIRPQAVPTFMTMTFPKKRLKRYLNLRARIVRVEKARGWQSGKRKEVGTSGSFTLQTESATASL